MPFFFHEDAGIFQRLLNPTLDCGPVNSFVTGEMILLPKPVCTKRPNAVTEKAKKFTWSLQCC